MPCPRRVSESLDRAWAVPWATPPPRRSRGPSVYLAPSVNARKQAAGNCEIREILELFLGVPGVETMPLTDNVNAGR